MTRVIRASTVRSRSIRWTWAGRLARGYLTVQTGIEGIAKGVFAAWETSALTRGALPGDCEEQPVDVLIVASEDGIADTWKPRLAVAGADMARVSFLDLDQLPPDWNLRDGRCDLHSRPTRRALRAGTAPTPAGGLSAAPDFTLSRRRLRVREAATSRSAAPGSAVARGVGGTGLRLLSSVPPAGQR